MDFQSLSRKELQTLCKRNKIPANMTNLAMADALKALQQVEGIEEISVPTTESANPYTPQKTQSNSPELLRTSRRTSTRQRKPINDPAFSIENGSQSSLPLTRSLRGTRRRVTQQEEQEQKDPESLAEIAAAEADGLEKLQTPMNQNGRKRTTGTSVRRKIQTTHVKEDKEEGKNGKQKEETAIRTYSTRRSARLVEKKISESVQEKQRGRTEAIIISVLSEEEFEDLEKKSKEDAEKSDVSDSVLGGNSSNTPETMRDLNDNVQEVKEAYEKIVLDGMEAAISDVVPSGAIPATEGLSVVLETDNQNEKICNPDTNPNQDPVSEDAAVATAISAEASMGLVLESCICEETCDSPKEVSFIKESNGEICENLHDVNVDVNMNHDQDCSENFLAVVEPVSDEVLGVGSPAASLQENDTQNKEMCDPDPSIEQDLGSEDVASAIVSGEVSCNAKEIVLESSMQQQVCNSPIEESVGEDSNGKNVMSSLPCGDQNQELDGQVPHGVTEDAHQDHDQEIGEIVSVVAGEIDEDMTSQLETDIKSEDSNQNVGSEDADVTVGEDSNGKNVMSSLTCGDQNQELDGQVPHGVTHGVTEDAHQDHDQEIGEIVSVVAGEIDEDIPSSQTDIKSEDSNQNVGSEDADVTVGEDSNGKNVMSSLTCGDQNQELDGQVPHGVTEDAHQDHDQEIGEIVSVVAGEIGEDIPSSPLETDIKSEDSNQNVGSEDADVTVGFDEVSSIIDLVEDSNGGHVISVLPLDANHDQILKNRESNEDPVGNNNEVICSLESVLAVEDEFDSEVSHEAWSEVEDSSLSFKSLCFESGNGTMQENLDTLDQEKCKMDEEAVDQKDLDLIKDSESPPEELRYLDFCSTERSESNHSLLKIQVTPRKLSNKKATPVRRMFKVLDENQDQNNSGNKLAKVTTVVAGEMKIGDASLTPRKSSNKKAMSVGWMVEDFDDKENNNSARKIEVRSGLKSTKLTTVVAEEKDQNKKAEGKALKDTSLRQLRKMFKEKLQIGNDASNMETNNKNVVEDQQQGKSRPALQSLAENCLMVDNREN